MSEKQVSAQCGDGTKEECDIALRYSVAWEVDGSPKITLNSKESDAWRQLVKSEETLESLRPGSHFDLLIYYSEDGFRCFLDDQEHAHLPYRLEDPRPDHVTVCGDVQIQRLLLV
nr:galectin-7-like [Parasteatoda tepidariorum]